ncbi:MAG: WYL domain-containing protein [Eubacteriales bacterium]|nr:WYL domain-containing protein [Eubacteriales bacterium]
MAGAGLRILTLYDILRRESDGEHPVTLSALRKLLEQQGIEAEERAVRRDMETLTDYGVALVHSEKKNEGYFLVSRTFGEVDVQILIDAVQAARFLPAVRSRELVGKLMGLASRHAQTRLRQEIFFDRRAKNENPQIYDSIAVLGAAIRRNQRVAFHYFGYDLHKAPVLRRQGKEYEVSPFGMEWNADAYYLVARMDAHEGFTHFRVDRMQDVRPLEQARMPLPECYDGRRLDMADYAKRTFSMFEGEEEWVEIQFDNALMTAVVDKLGRDVMTMPQSDGTFVLTTKLVVGPGLFAWLAHFGAQAQIKAPPEARARMKEHLSAMLRQY